MMGGAVRPSTLEALKQRGWAWCQAPTGINGYWNNICARSNFVLMDLHLDGVDPLQTEGKLAGKEVPYSYLSTASTKGRMQDTANTSNSDTLVKNWISHPGLAGAQLAHCTQEGK